MAEELAGTPEDPRQRSRYHAGMARFVETNQQLAPGVGPCDQSDVQIRTENRGSGQSFLFAVPTLLMG